MTFFANCEKMKLDGLRGFCKITNIHRIANLLFTLQTQTESIETRLFIQQGEVLLNLKKRHQTPPNSARDHPSPPKPQNFLFCKFKGLNERFGHNKEKQRFVTDSNAQTKEISKRLTNI